MHSLQPKQIKLKPEEVEKLTKELNISLTQLPKIRVSDLSLPKDCSVGDVLKIERKDDDGQTGVYYRVVVV